MDHAPAPLRLSEQLCEKIEEQIVTGALRPGARLDEQELAAEFGVSRTPIREALIQLASAGLVDTRPRRGAVVAEGTPEGLKAELGGDVVSLTLEVGEGAEERLARVEGVREVVRDGGARLRVTVVDAPRRIAALVGAVAELGVLEVTLQRPSLETVFLHHTGHAFEESRTPERAA